MNIKRLQEMLLANYGVGRIVDHEITASGVAFAIYKLEGEYVDTPMYYVIHYDYMLQAVGTTSHGHATQIYNMLLSAAGIE